MSYWALQNCKLLLPRHCFEVFWLNMYLGVCMGIEQEENLSCWNDPTGSTAAIAVILEGIAVTIYSEDLGSAVEFWYHDHPISAGTEIWTKFRK